MIEERRAENIDEQKARKVYNEIKSLEDVDGSGLIYAAYEKEELGNFFDYQMSVIYGIEPSFRAFWDKAYLPFVQHLKNEMNGESGESFSEKKYAVK